MDSQNFISFNHMFKKILTVTLLAVSVTALSSCGKEEAPPKIPPVYETVTVSDNNMWSNLGTGSVGKIGSGNLLFSFELQNNKFIIDKEMDNFNENYSVFLKSKDTKDTSYVGFKLFSVSDLSFEYGKDLERELQTKLNYVTKYVDLGDCVVKSEGTEKGPGWIYVKKCGEQDYIVQLLNVPYEKKDGAVDVGYKAYPLTKEIRAFIIQEYFDKNNTAESFDTSKHVITKNGSKTYKYSKDATTPAANGSIKVIKKKSEQYDLFTKRTISLKGDMGIIMDVLIDKTANYDTDFEIAKNLKILGDINITSVPGKFADYEVFDGLDAKYNIHLLYRKALVKPKNLIEFIPRFPNTMYVKTFVGKSTSEVAKAEADFIKDFAYKPGYEGKSEYPNSFVYTYTGDRKKYVLIIGRSERGHKDYQGKYVYAEIDKTFLTNNIKTFVDFLGKIQ